MNKYLPLIMVLAFWGIFLWGMNNPKVGEGVIAISVVGITIFIISLGKKILWKLIDNSK
jgi:hypothetical protein